MDLQAFWAAHPRAAVAFSGGADSAYLLWSAADAGADVRAYFVRTEFQPRFELDDARRLAEQLDVPLTVLEQSALADPAVAANGPDRCYHCKKRIFGAILARAAADGYAVLCDGTNASDDPGDRPGTRALAELQVLSPLRLCGITKDQVRRGAKAAGLFVWDKPSYACLATRIPTGESIRAEKLQRVERGEAVLMDMGFTDFRLRLKDGGLLQVTEAQQPLAKTHWNEIIDRLGGDFPALRLDETPRVSRES